LLEALLNPEDCLGTPLLGGPRLRELDEQTFRHLRYPPVDELRPVVGAEVMLRNRNRCRIASSTWSQIPLTGLLHAARYLPLCHRVHSY